MALITTPSLRRRINITTDLPKQNAYTLALNGEYAHVAFDEMQLYRREITEVHIHNNITNAWIYWYTGEVNDKPVIESGDVLQYMEQKKQSLS